MTGGSNGLENLKGLSLSRQKIGEPHG